jgi:hypothetical protein
LVATPENLQPQRNNYGFMFIYMVECDLLYGNTLSAEYNLDFEFINQNSFSWSVPFANSIKVPTTTPASLVNSFCKFRA